MRQTHKLHANGRAGFAPVHGMCMTREYRAWRHMMNRVYNTKTKDYPRYGGRGITVDPYWHLFENFYADMGPCPEGMSLDREKNDEGYCKNNCRWATPSTQAKNRSTTVWLTFNGETLCLKDWAARTGIKAVTIAFRLKQGWSVERALTPGDRRAK